MADSSNFEHLSLQRGSLQLSHRAFLSMGVLLAVLLAFALGIGSGVFHSGPQTNAQRAEMIDTQIRCPSCIDVSVADSQESTAIAVRHEVAHLVAAGVSTQQIESTLVDSYGPSILLRPPDRGLTSLLWMLPIAIGIGGSIGFGLFFWRRTHDFNALRKTVESQ